jgi:hypothetical protein
MRCTMYQHADVPVMSFPQCRIMISASYRHALSCCPTSLSPVISCHIDVSCPMLVLFPILSHLAHSFDAGIPKQLHHHVLHHTSSCIFPRRTPSFIAPCSLFVLLPSSQSPHLTSSPSYSSPHCTSPLIVPPAIILLVVPVTSSVKANPNPAPATRKPGTRGNPREICLQKPGPDRAQRHPRGPAAARASGLGPGFCCCARARGCSQCAAAQPAGCGCCAARGSSRRPCVPSRTEVAP